MKNLTMQKLKKPNKKDSRKRKSSASLDIVLSEPKENTCNEVNSSIQNVSPPNSLKARKTSLTLSENGEPLVKKGKKVKEPKVADDAKSEKQNENSTLTVTELDSSILERCKNVPLSNNQKGRIRQALRAQLQGSDNTISIDIINGKIQAILKNSENLTDSDLRKIRILHNMLQTVQNTEVPEVKKKKKKKNKKPKADKKKGEKISEGGDENVPEGVKPKEENAQKKKGPKRYVVFLGNLPLNVDKEKLMNHFAELSSQIKDIRIPKASEEKKSAIAFMELTNKPSYEMALSKNHSMLDNKRINVKFTLQENSKMTKSEAQGKVAKLAALQKAGKLAGSTAMVKKRTHRRNIMKRAKAKQAAAENA